MALRAYAWLKQPHEFKMLSLRNPFVGYKGGDKATFLSIVWIVRLMPCSLPTSLRPCVRLFQRWHSSSSVLLTRLLHSTGLARNSVHFRYLTMATRLSFTSEQ